MMAGGSYADSHSENYRVPHTLAAITNHRLLEET
jgi:hypothetical protein